MRSSQYNRKAAGDPAFTLIEVLVVVAIIALLIAILLPSLGRARQQAKIAACKGNLHDIGNGCLAYTMTYRDYYPLTSDQNDDNNWFALWKSRGGLRNVNVLLCPASKNVIRLETLKGAVDYNTSPTKVKVPYLKDPTGIKGAADICRTANYRDDDTGGHSYEYSAVYGGAAGDPYRPLAGAHRRSKHFAGYQSEIALAWDEDKDTGTKFGNPDAGCTPSLGEGNDCPQPWDNHGAIGANFLFGDGHATFVSKVGGTWNDMTAGQQNKPYVFGAVSSVKQSVNMRIDKLHSRSWEPWYYYRW